MPVITVIASKTLVKDLPDGTRVVGNFVIDQIGGNAHPHFSATGEVYEPRKLSGAVRHRRGYEPDSFGCIHDDLRAAFPDMASFIDMHLSDFPSGLPMHAVANGAFFATTEGRPDLAASLLRCTIEELPDTEGLAYGDEAQQEYACFVDSRATLYAAQAQAALALVATVES